MATCSSIFPGKSHGQRSLMRYSPWGRKELDMTEHTYAYVYVYMYISVSMYLSICMCVCL